MSLCFFGMSFFALSKSGFYHLVPMSIGMTIYILLLKASMDRITNIELNNDEKKVLHPLATGLSYDLINNSCRVLRELKIPKEELNSILVFVEKNSFQEPLLFRIPQFFSSLFWAVMSIITVVVGVYQISIPNDAINKVTDTVNDSTNTNNLDFIFLTFLLLLFTFSITVYFFKSIQPLSINSRVKRLLSILTIDVCGK